MIGLFQHTSHLKCLSSVHCTLDNRRPCVLYDRSSGVEHLDNVRAVLWVTHSFSTSPEDWTVLHAPSQIDYISVCSIASWLSLQPWSRLDYNVVMTFRLPHRGFSLTTVHTHRPWKVFESGGHVLRKNWQMKAMLGVSTGGGRLLTQLGGSVGFAPKNFMCKMVHFEF